MRAKNIILIVEGLSCTLLEKWLTKRDMPNLWGLFENQGGRLNSLSVPYEASCLMTAFTGLSPGEHGVFSYWKVHNDRQAPRLWASGDLPIEAIWQWDECRELKFGIINIFGTHPPYPVNGAMLSYLFYPRRDCCYPPTLVPDYIKRGYSYGQDAYVGLGYARGHSNTGNTRDQFFNQLIDIENMRVPFALELLNEVDILIVNCTLLERLSHHYWQELDEESPYKENETALFLAYRHMDRMIERFIDKLGEDDHLFIFSEIGFGSLKQFISINHYLEKGGLLVEDFSGEIIPKKTRAFESVQGTMGININTKKNYTDGIVPDEDYDLIRQEIIALLKNTINPATGRNLFTQILRREEIYHGSHIEIAPDIVLIPADMRYLPRGDRYWADRVQREAQSGWHRSQSVWTGTGPLLDGIKHDCSLYDIAPTIVSLCGLSTSRELAGHPINRYCG